MNQKLAGVVGCVVIWSLSTGCTAFPAADVSGVDGVARKAEDVAASIGGSGGFGGAMMAGYGDHAPAHMGFVDSADLASPTETMSIHLRNESNQDCEFHLSYFVHDEQSGDHMMTAVVSAGDEQMVTIPCSEIVGMGPLDTPGDVGCVLDSGETVPNSMAVPAFLGMDYQCGGDMEFVLMADADDLDSDGDTLELVIQSQAMLSHLENGGPNGHMHGDNGGMMGLHRLIP